MNLAQEYFKIRHGLRISNNTATHLTVDPSTFSFPGNTVTLGSNTSTFSFTANNYNMTGNTLSFTGNSATWNVTNYLTIMGGKKLGIGNAAPTVALHITATDAVFLPVGNTGQRPTAANGMLRYNSETFRFEGHANGAWGSLGGGGGYYKGNLGTIGNAENANNLYRINANTHSANVTIAASENACVTGPVTIANGFSLVVDTGGRVVVL